MASRSFWSMMACSALWVACLPPDKQVGSPPPLATIPAAMLPTPSPSTHAALPTGQVATAELGAALLQLSDLPSGWAAVAVADPPRHIPCGEEMPRLRDRALIVVATAFTGAPSVNAFLTQTLIRYPGGDAQRIVSRLRHLIERCPQWQETSSTGTVIQLRLTPILLALTGDDVVAYRLTEIDGGVVAQTETVIVRRTDTVSAVSLGALALGSPPRTDTEQLVRLVLVTDSRLRVLAE